MPFKLLGVNHIGLAPKDPQKAKQFFTLLLNLSDLGSELVRDQKTMTHILRSSNTSPTSLEPRLEILEPENGEGPIAQFLAKKGSGVHHVALGVDNVEAAVQHLLQNGVRMIDEKPRNGAHHTRIAFVHPESTGGLLVELVQE